MPEKLYLATLHFWPRPDSSAPFVMNVVIDGDPLRYLLEQHRDNPQERWALLSAVEIADTPWARVCLADMGALSVRALKEPPKDDAPIYIVNVDLGPEGEITEGVFSSTERAHKYIERLQKSGNHYGYNVHEFVLDRESPNPNFGRSLDEESG